MNTYTNLALPVRGDMVPEMTRRARTLGLQATALAHVLESLPAGALAPLVQARGVVELARLQSFLETLADALGCQVNPQVDEASRG